MTMNTRTKKMLMWSALAVVTAGLTLVLKHENRTGPRQGDDGRSAAVREPIAKSEDRQAGMPDVRGSKTAIPLTGRTAVEPEVPAGGAGILLQTNLGYDERLRAARSLDSRLTLTEADGLMVYLKTHGSRDGLPGKRERFLKNMVMDVLIQSPADQDEITGGLIGIYRDSGQDPVVRDYAVQHLGLLFENAGDAQRRQIQQALREALGEKQGTIGGTSLLALHRLAETHEEIDRQHLAQTALQLAADEQCGEATRRTALTVCGMLGEKNVLPTARALAQGAASVPLRISAIAALGFVGDDEATEYLRSLVLDGSNSRLQPAVRAALERVEERKGKS
jgi:hypothetical protein